MKRKDFEGLRGYLTSLTRAGDVSASAVHPRLPVGPNGAIPVGLRPIPSSSQAPKRTNATIVYARTCNGLKTGDIAFTRKTAVPAMRTATAAGLATRIFSLQELNDVLQGAEPMSMAKAGRELIAVSPDGVVNNVDGDGEFGNDSIANVALQGFCRLGVAQLPRANNGDYVYVALHAHPQGADTFKFELSTFLASHVTLGKVAMETMHAAWSIGRIVDGHQSRSMATVNVGICPVHGAVKDRLGKMWHDARKATVG